MASPCKQHTKMTNRRERPEAPFLQLPGELRNYIYELAFENGSDTVDIADAFLRPVRANMSPAMNLRRATAAPPSSALLRCCRKIHSECKDTFGEATRRYWKKVFTLDMIQFTLPENFDELVPMDRINTLIVTEKHREMTYHLVELPSLKELRSGDFWMWWSAIMEREK